MSPETLSSLAAILLSLAFSYIPGLSSWFDALDGVKKRLVMLACLVLVSLASVGIACLPPSPSVLRWGGAGGGVNLLVGGAGGGVDGWGGVGFACTQSGLVGFLRSFALAVVANQSAYLITPKPSANSSQPTVQSES